jgi:hypothetical protein
MGKIIGIRQKNPAFSGFTPADGKFNLQSDDGDPAPKKRLKRAAVWWNAAARKEAGIAPERVFEAA